MTDLSVWRERSAAGQHEVDPPAQHGLQLVEDESVEYGGRVAVSVPPQLVVVTKLEQRLKVCSSSADSFSQILLYPVHYERDGAHDGGSE